MEAVLARLCRAAAWLGLWQSQRAAGSGVCFCLLPSAPPTRRRSTPRKDCTLVMPIPSLSFSEPLIRTNVVTGGTRDGG